MTSQPVPPRRERWLPFLCGAAIFVGVAWHLTIRDRVPSPLFAIYYSLPRPLLLALAILGCLRATTRLGRRILGVAAIALCIWVGVSDVAWRVPTPGDSPGDSQGETIVFWNVGHTLIDDYVAVDEVLATSPAAVGLVETGPLPAEWIADWQAKHPDYTFVTPYREMLIAVRGQVLNQAYHRLPHNSHMAWVELEIDSRLVRVVVVDILANPGISRGDALTRLTERLEEWDDRPLIVMGDFNTPVESAWMSGIRRNFREAFLTAGTGYAPTWPWPAPVLKLDQIWLNRFVAPDRAWQQGTWRSDHRMQWAEVHFRETVEQDQR